MPIYYLLRRFDFWYYLLLALILMTEWLWVTIKVCKTTRSVFALTLLSFTLLLTTSFIYMAIGVYNFWLSLICGFFFGSLAMQSWLFAMQYLKSYLYTFVNANSVVYKIHTFIKYFLIGTYTTIMIYFRCR